MIPKVGDKVEIKIGDLVDVGLISHIYPSIKDMYYIKLNTGPVYHLTEIAIKQFCTVLQEDVCDCYHETDRFKPYSDGECWGTKEKDPCDCGGDKSKCNYYPEKRSLTVRNTDPIDMDKIMTKNIVTPKNEVDIHKIIDDAMEKKDRAVHILILPTSTSVNVMPYEAGTPRWINKGVLGYECPECHAIADFPSLYCPTCGATVARPESEDPANGND